jgi:transposase
MRVGRPSIPPERLLRAQLLQIFYSIRSERLLMEQLDYNLLFRWFVGMDMDEPIWDPTVFTKNRDRLLNQDIAVEGGRAYQGPRTNVMKPGDGARGL